MFGREVKLLNNSTLQAGATEFKFDASTLPSGVYNYTLLSDGIVLTNQMVIIK